MVGLPVRDSFELLRDIYRIPPERYRRQLRRLADLLELGPLLDVPVRQLSLGQRMRAELAAALLHEPRVLSLDEPTIGLDVVAKERVRQHVAAVNREDGVTVLLTTHDMGDIERLCPRVILIDRGRIAYDGPLARLRERYGRERWLVVDLEGEPDGVVLEGAELVRREGGRCRFRFDGRQVRASELIRRLGERYAIRDVSIREAETEDVIRRLYEEWAAPAR